MSFALPMVMLAVAFVGFVLLVTILTDSLGPFD